MPSSWQEGWKMTPHATSAQIAEVWKAAQPPQQQPTTPMVAAPCSLA
jgi:hypothetical protein